MNELLHEYNIKVDIDLVEAISLGHDLGHTPFGHAGEREINEILSFKCNKINKLIEEHLFSLGDSLSGEEKKSKEESMGFKHNWQSLRIVKHLSRDHAMFDMKLSKATMAGILLHSSLKYKKENTPPVYYAYYLETFTELDRYTWSLEALVVSLADEIAQRHHDIEDALSCHYLSPKRVIEILSNTPTELELKEKDLANCPKDLSILTTMLNKNKDASKGDLEKAAEDTETFLGMISKYIVNWLVTDCVGESREIIKGKMENNLDVFGETILINSNNDNNVTINDKIYKQLVSFSQETNYADLLLQYLRKVVLNSRNVQRMDKKGAYIIRKLFAAYIVAPQQMPDKSIFAIFREYLRRYYPEKLGGIEAKQRHLFQDAADARMTLDYCLNKKETGKEQVLPITFVTNITVELSSVRFKLSLLRVIADYISGMTDAYAENEYRKLYGIDHDIEAY